VSRRPRVTVLVRLAVAAALPVLAACGAASGHRTTTARAAGRQPACPVVVDGELQAIAQRIYAQAAGGRNVAAVRRRLSHASALAAAVYAGDPAATLAALHPLLKHQVRRLIVTRGVHVLADLGRAPALAPVRGEILDRAGHPVGRYVVAVAGDTAIADIIRTITGATVDVAPGVDDPITVRATAWPAGPLTIGLRPTAAASSGGDCGATAAATRANVVRDAALRLYTAEASGPATQRVLRHVATDRGFQRAVAARDPVALRAAIIRFFRQRSLHVVRIRAFARGGRLIGDVGGPYVLAPAQRTVRARDGRVLGKVVLSVQDDAGYLKLLHRFTGAGVVLRGAAGPIPGAVPLRGVGAVRRVHLTVGAFPTGDLGVTLETPTATPTS